MLTPSKLPFWLPLLAVACLCTPLSAQERVPVDTPFVLTWDAPAPKPGAPIQGFRVFVDSQAVGGDLSPTAAEFLIPGQAEGPHTLEVEAFNRAGAGRSQPLPIVAALEVPNPPTNLRTRPRTVAVTVEPDGRVLVRLEFSKEPPHP